MQGTVRRGSTGNARAGIESVKKMPATTIRRPQMRKFMQNLFFYGGIFFAMLLVALAHQFKLAEEAVIVGAGIGFVGVCWSIKRLTAWAREEQSP